jgi:hypothetical protein
MLRDFQWLIFAILLLTSSFMFYVNYKDMHPPRVLTYVPYGGINARGVYVAGFTYVGTPLPDPCPKENIIMAISEIESRENLRSVILLFKHQVID